MSQETVSISELNRDTSKVVQGVAARHRPLVVTNHHRSMGVALVPVDDGPAVLDRLVADGTVVAPTVHGTAPGSVPAERGDPDLDVAAALVADRDEERW